MQEGAAMLPDLLPNFADGPTAGKRIEKRARRLIAHPDPQQYAVGFFLLGLALAAQGVAHA